MLARYSSLAVYLLLVVLAVAAGASFEAGEWYFREVGKPSWSPPPWFFGPAWAIAYLFAALAAWQAWLTEHYDRLKALTWWLAMLVLNVAWSFLFFGMHRTGWAWPVLGLALLAAVLCTLAFRRLSGQAAGLMVPCLIWMIFCWALNLAVWALNGGFLGRFFM